MARRIRCPARPGGCVALRPLPGTPAVGKARPVVAHAAAQLRDAVAIAASAPRAPREISGPNRKSSSSACAAPSNSGRSTSQLRACRPSRSGRRTGAGTGPRHACAPGAHRRPRPSSRRLCRPTAVRSARGPGCGKRPKRRRVCAAEGQEQLHLVAVGARKHGHAVPALGVCEDLEQGPRRHHDPVTEQRRPAIHARRRLHRGQHP
jgi:hypothetical protein